MVSEANRSELPPTRDLFERYGAMVYRRCRELLRDEERARDAVQEVFLRVVEKRGRFRGDCAPSTWLYAIATLQCLQRLRDGIRHASKLGDLMAEAESPMPVQPEDRLMLVRLLEQEPDEVRLMVYLRYADGLSMEEIAQAVGRSRKTVSERVQGFVANARRRLAREGVR